MSSFELRDACGDDFTVAPHTLNDGTPAVLMTATEYDGPDTVAEATVFIPLDRLEEVIAGIRDMARQAGGQPAPELPRPVVHINPAPRAEETVRYVPVRGPERA